MNLLSLAPIALLALATLPSCASSGNRPLPLTPIQQVSATDSLVGSPVQAAQEPLPNFIGADLKFGDSCSDSLHDFRAIPVDVVPGNRNDRSIHSEFGYAHDTAQTEDGFGTYAGALTLELQPQEFYGGARFREQFALIEPYMGVGVPQLTAPSQNNIGLINTQEPGGITGDDIHSGLLLHSGDRWGVGVDLWSLEPGDSSFGNGPVDSDYYWAGFVLSASF